MLILFNYFFFEIDFEIGFAISGLDLRLS